MVSFANASVFCLKMSLYSFITYNAKIMKLIKTRADMNGR